MTSVKRNFRIVRYRSSGREYVQVVVDFKDSKWHTRAVKSFGQLSEGSLRSAQECLKDLTRYASRDEDPIPIGTTDEVFWEGFYTGLKSLPLSIPLLPAYALRDLSKMVEWLLANISGSLENLVDATQPDMSPEEKGRFIDWLNGWPLEARSKILLYKWSYP